MRFRPTVPTEALYSWESQVCQYPYKGEPGISYFPGEIAEGIVHCLLFRNEKGHIRGILNYFDFQTVWEKPGNVNIWVHPKCHRQGIGTALWKEAVRRWGVTLENQNMTPAGAAFATALTRKEKASGN